jgi:propanol-preferring alcohol dehydrogenase
VLELAVAGRLRCQVETQPLDKVNEVLARLQRGAISGRVVLRCCA